MTGWLKRHTSMRGRLAILLVVLLVLPMVAAGWMGYRDVLVGELGEDGSGWSDDREMAAKFQLDESVRGFRRFLELNLADLGLRAAGQAEGDAAALAAAFEDLPALLRPACVVVLGSRGEASPALSASWRAAFAPLLPPQAVRAGYLSLPSGGPEGSPPRAESLYQAVIAPRPGGGAVLVLRDLAGESGKALLASLPFGVSVSRSVALRDQRVLARHVGSQSGEARRRTAGASPLQPGLWSRVLDHDAVLQECGEGSRTGALALSDLQGQPVGLAIVQADDQDLVPQHCHPSATVSRVARLVGWIALIGVLLALGLGWAAPRWVWSDIKDSTDTIFGSVARLRELVRRNSRAMGEQARLVQSVLDAVSALETASQSIADTSRALAHSAEQSAWVSQSGNQRAEVSQRAVLDVRDRVEDISAQMEELERRCGAIGSLLGFIDHLSNETNTLSINAAIQAVGSGSSGREFTVVASEIRKLADLALDSTQDIKRLIEEIQESSRATLGATQEGCREVDKCLSSFEELESAFARILRWVETTTQSARGIETSTARQSDALQSVAQSVEALEERAKETEGNFHDVVAAADELAELGSKMNDTWRVG